MAQTKQRVNAALTAAENSKSGNFKDILNGFYQLAFKTLSKDEKAIEFNSSLFAFIKKHDNDILKTRTRADIRFLRNFQVNTKINLDDEFNFNGYSAGFTYAIVNERDRSFVNLTGTDYDLHNVEFKRLLMGVTNSYLIPGPPGITAADRSILTESLNTISNDIVNDRDSGEALYATVVADLDAAIAASPYFGALPGAPYTTVSARALISGLRATHMNNLENKPLWTISTDGIADKNNKFNRINAETIFLAGNRFGELDFRAKFSYADTLAVSMPRSVINAKLGYNFKVIKGSDNKSVLELKGYGEYNNILKNALPDEKESTFLANAELRVRVTDNLWIPFTIKYDIENANVLGFLNISYNFGD
ncbi:MAG: hypothetical protein PSV16_09330 [Flavobacterium sp.]|nr:hypothetical protein [Flavobacterium sp.]